MKQRSRELRQACAALKAFVQEAECSRKPLGDARCAELRTLANECEHLLICAGDACPSANLLQRAAALIERHDPLAALRAAKLDHIERLTMACDRLMSAGALPPPPYIETLGAAVCDYESAHSTGNDTHLLAFAWDILAQAEAGLGEAVEDEHYDSAEQRYRRQASAAAPVLTLVTRAAG